MPLPSRILAALRRAASPGARVWVLPNLVLGLFAIALFALLAVLGRHETETRRNALARDVQWAEQTIRTRLAANEDFLQLLAKEVAEERQDADSSSRRAAEHVAANPELTQVAWIDADQVVRWVAPRETTAWNRGERLSIPEQALAFQRAQRTGTPAYSMPAPAADESASIEIHVPVFRDRLFRGVVVGIYALDRSVAAAAAQTMVPINDTGAPGAPLPAALPDTGFAGRPLPSQMAPPLAPPR